MSVATLSFCQHSPYRRLIGVGGIGTGLFFALEGDHNLGRNESRPARFLEIKDYCKLHIISHYVSVLLGAGSQGDSFHVLPIGKVGDDEVGRRLLQEMAVVGIDIRHVDKVPGQPTLLSICFQYPDGAGGNITTSNSAASLLAAEDISQRKDLLAAEGDRTLVLAVPEVPFEARQELLQLATAHGAFRAGSFTASEMVRLREENLLGLLDLVAMNESEAGTLLGTAFDVTDPQPFLNRCATLVRSFQPQCRILISTGKHGAFALSNSVWDYCPAPPVSVVHTAGAGDALLAGVLAALVVGIPLVTAKPFRKTFRDRPLSSALDLGVLLASYSVTSPHTIHPDANLETLLGFAQRLGVAFSNEMTCHFSSRLSE